MDRVWPELVFCEGAGRCKWWVCLLPGKKWERHFLHFLLTLGPTTEVGACTAIAKQPKLSLSPIWFVKNQSVERSGCGRQHTNTYIRIRQNKTSTKIIPLEKKLLFCNILKFYEEYSALGILKKLEILQRTWKYSLKSYIPLSIFIREIDVKPFNIILKQSDVLHFLFRCKMRTIFIWVTTLVCHS
jgi:hypothetical protein